MMNRHNPDFYLRILVVDDEQEYLDTFRDITRKLGHVMVGTTDPFEAIMLVEQSFINMNPFDAAFIDFLMPRMNGIKVAQRIRAIDPDLVRVAISRDKTIKTRMRIVDSLAFRFYLSKGSDQLSFEKFFNLLINTKIRQYSGVESRLSRALEKQYQEETDELGNLKDTIIKVTDMEHVEPIKKPAARKKKTEAKKVITSEKQATVKKKTSRKGSQKKTDIKKS